MTEFVEESSYYNDNNSKKCDDQILQSILISLIKYGPSFNVDKQIE